MKWIIILLTAVLLPAGLYAQNITAAEYFIDEDAGFGNNTAIPITGSGNDQTIDFTVNLDGIEEGLHTLGIRAKDANGVWSLVTNRIFLVFNEVVPATVVAAEYFIDEDAGFGNNTAIEVGSAAAADTLNFQADLSGISPGVHTLYVRAQDSRGNWSLVTQRVFVVADDEEVSNIVALNYYYYDIAEATVVGEGQYTYQLPEPAPVVDTEFAATVDPLESGKNYLMYIWAVDDEGISSLVSTTQFTFTETIPINISALNVTDVSCAGDENGSVTIEASGGVGSLLYSSSADSANYSSSNTIEGLAPGEYTAYVRGNNNNYIESRTFTISGPEPLALSSPEVQGVDCASDANGSINISVSGGAGSGYAYRLGDADYQSTGTFDNLPAGTYTLTARDANECTISTDVTIPFDRTAPEAPTIRRSDESDEVRELSLIAENVAAGATLQWYRNDEAIAGATNTEVAITEAGNYYVIASNGGCASQASEAIAITSMAEAVASQIRFYPVPSQDEVTLEVPPGLLRGAVSLELISPSGQVLKSESFGRGISGETRLDISTLSRGTYFILLRSEEQVVRKRISKY